jgi:hypothetical protein
MGFGGYMLQDGKMKHLDILWSSESGMIAPCTQEGLAEHTVETKDNGAVKFDPEFQGKLDRLGKKFSREPDDFDRTVADFNEYVIGIKYQMNYGELQDDDEEPREGITLDDIRVLYDAGASLKECFKHFMVKAG